MGQTRKRVGELARPAWPPKSRDDATAGIVSLREPRSVEDEHIQRGVRCIINTSDGKFTAVTDDCWKVNKLIEEADK